MIEAKSKHYCDRSSLNICCSFRNLTWFSSVGGPLSILLGQNNYLSSSFSDSDACSDLLRAFHDRVFVTIGSVCSSLVSPIQFSDLQKQMKTAVVMGWKMPSVSSSCVTVLLVALS